MKDLMEYYDKLKEYTDKHLTTKELNELGITNYFINKLTENGKLEKVKRGTYCVKSLSKQKNSKSFSAIHYFCENVFKGNYKLAYKYLMSSYSFRTNHKNDNVIRIGFILLQEIFKNRNPFSSLDDLQELTLEEKPNSLYWNQFCTSVVNNDYHAAKENIEKSAQEQLKNQGFIGEVTNAMTALVNKVLEIKALNISNSQRGNKGSINDAKYHFNKFLKIFRIDNLEESMQELSLSLSYTDPSHVNYLHNRELLNMFEKLVAMRDKCEILEEMNINYKLNAEPINNFNFAIEKGDYKKANAFLHIVKTNNSVVVDVKRQLLNEMNKLDKINREKQTSIAPTEPSKEDVEVKEDVPTLENTPQESSLEEQKNMEDTQETVIEPVDRLIDEELMKEAAKLELNYDIIYDLVYNRNYDLAYALVKGDKDRGKLDRLCDIISRLIKRIKKLEKGLVTPPKYSELTGDKFKDFYKAISDHNYDYAYSLTDELIDKLTEKGEDSQEMEIYKLLLDDLVRLREKVDKALEEIKGLSERINELSLKQVITREDIEELMELLLRKIELEVEISRPFANDASLLNIAEMTILSLEGKLNNTDFCEVECESKVASELFIAAMNQGDYLTSKRLIALINWCDVCSVYNFTFLKLAKKMLNIMISNMRMITDQTVIKDKIAEEPITEEMETKISELVNQLMTPKECMEKEFGAFLHEMRNLIKERHYEEVYQAFINTDFPIDKLEGIADIIGNIAFIKGNLDHKANELYATYESSLENNDPNYLEHLNAYKKFISENYMEESKYYKQKMLKSQE